MDRNCVCRVEDGIIYSGMTEYEAEGYFPDGWYVDMRDTGDGIDGPFDTEEEAADEAERRG